MSLPSAAVQVMLHGGGGGGCLDFQGIQPSHISPEVNDYDRCDGQLVATVL